MKKKVFQWGAHLKDRGLLPKTGETAEPKPKRKKATTPTVSANVLTQSVINYMALKGWKAWRNNNGAVYDPVKNCFRKNKQALLGVPDVLGFCRKSGLFASVEIKAGSDKLSKHQTHFLEEVTKSGGFACEAREIGQFMKDFDEYLLKHHSHGRE